MTPYLQDPDVTLYHGDVLDVLREMEAGSVDCVVTSPPYWGLRDYGTGAWEGGDEGCDHLLPLTPQLDRAGGQATGTRGDQPSAHRGTSQFRDTCGKCGATRIDQQLGLEPTPEQYVERMVEVFREVRRVLAPHGTVWLNLGDSYYAAGWESRRRNEVGSGSFAPEDRRSHTGVVDGLKVKDLVGIPWRTAFALQADGWYMRSDIIWSKPNPMPESVTDRPTKAHEYVFLLSKQPRYFFDQEAVREPHNEHWKSIDARHPHNPIQKHPESPYRTRHSRGGAMGFSPGGRNIRSVWEIATQPYPEAHFATFPEELARRCIAAGCPEQVCRVCGKARERVVEVERGGPSTLAERQKAAGGEMRTTFYRLDKAHTPTGKTPGSDTRGYPSRKSETTGFTDCGCTHPSKKPNVYHPDDCTCEECEWVHPRDRFRPGIVLDPFVGSGTTCHVARKLGRRSIGIDLSAEYLALAARRLQQQSLFALDNGAERSPSAERAEPELTQAAADRSSEAVQANKGKVTSDSP